MKHFREREVPGEEGQEIKKSPKEESDSSGIRRNAGLRRITQEKQRVRSRKKWKRKNCTKCGQFFRRK